MTNTPETDGENAVMYSTEDTFEASFLWSRGVHFSHLEQTNASQRRCKFIFKVPKHINLIELKKLWADESFSRPLKDLLLKRKTLQDEIRRFYSKNSETLDV